MGPAGAFIFCQSTTVQSRLYTLKSDTSKHLSSATFIFCALPHLSQGQYPHFHNREFPSILEWIRFTTSCCCCLTKQSASSIFLIAAIGQKQPIWAHKCLLWWTINGRMITGTLWIVHYWKKEEEKKEKEFLQVGERRREDSIWLSSHKFQNICKLLFTWMILRVKRKTVQNKKL